MISREHTCDQMTRGLVTTSMGGGSHPIAPSPIAACRPPDALPTPHSAAIDTRQRLPSRLFPRGGVPHSHFRRLSPCALSLSLSGCRLLVPARASPVRPAVAAAGMVAFVPALPLRASPAHGAAVRRAPTPVRAVTPRMSIAEVDVYFPNEKRHEGAFVV